MTGPHIEQADRDLLDDHTLSAEPQPAFDEENTHA